VISEMASSGEVEMLVAAIRCDLCKKAHEIECRKAGQDPTVPDGWATVVPMVNIKGAPKISSFRGKLWNERTRGFDIEPTDDQKIKLSSKSHFSERRKKLREKFDKSHVCDDCVEQLLTGKISLKIGSSSGQDK
jgi:hypothetical protein